MEERRSCPAYMKLYLVVSSSSYPVQLNLWYALGTFPHDAEQLPVSSLLQHFNVVVPVKVNYVLVHDLVLATYSYSQVLKAL